MDRFLAAIRHGDLKGLLDVLAPDVVAVADGGGLAAAARHPIEGAERVARFPIGGARSADFELKPVWLNGSPACRIDVGGEVASAARLGTKTHEDTWRHKAHSWWKRCRLSKRRSGPFARPSSLTIRYRSADRCVRGLPCP